MHYFFSPQLALEIFSRADNKPGHLLRPDFIYRSNVETRY